MSWSFSAVGKPAAVALRTRQQIETGHKCAEPEDTARRNILEVAAAVAESHAAGYLVQVEASGSMYVLLDQVQTQNIRLEVKTIHGFLE